jgi:hypothetical protein
MKTQVALRLDAKVVEAAKSQADRENRSLANFVETVLAEALILPPGDGRPILSIAVTDAELEGAVVIDDEGNPDPEETARLHRVIGTADKGRHR